VIISQVSNWTLARYWGEDVPDEVKIVTAAATVRRHSIAVPSMLPPLTTVIEVRKIAGPRTVYGLLGATYKPSDGTDLVIEFSMCHAFRAIASSLLSDEHPRVGLPEWIVNGIADIVSNYAYSVLHQSAQISFCFAAYSEISSNESIFEMLAKCILDTFASGIAITTSDQLALVLRRHI
jgi:hypothetical protein